MLHSILTMPLWLSAPLLVGGITILAVAGLIPTRSWIKERLDDQYYDVAQGLYAAAGVMYAFIAAFVLIVVWEGFGSASTASTQEASGLVAVYRMSEAFPPGPQHAMRQLLRNYDRAVIEDEWPAMENNGSSPSASAALSRLYRFYGVYHPNASWEVPYRESFTRLNEISDQRTQRLLATGSSLPDVLWWLLLGGFLLLILFSYVFYLTDLPLQMLMTGATTALMAAVLFLILILNHPFVGELRIEPDAFRHAIDTFKTIDRMH